MFSLMTFMANVSDKGRWDSFRVMGRACPPTATRHVPSDSQPLLQQVAAGLLSQPIVILPHLVLQTGMACTVQYREQWGESSGKKALRLQRYGVA